MVLVNTTYLIGCCDLMLIQPCIKVMCCSLLWLTLHIRAGISISHLSIPGIVAHGRCYISHCFFVTYHISLVLIIFLSVIKSFLVIINISSSIIFNLLIFFSAFIFCFCFFYFSTCSVLLLFFIFIVL